jgi:hypothetical protein
MNVGGLMLLLIYIFTITGVNLFSTVKVSEPLGELVNFQSFGYGFLLLFRASTGEGWHEIMYGLMRQPSAYFECSNDKFSYQKYLENDKIT